MLIRSLVVLFFDNTTPSNGSFKKSNNLILCYLNKHK